MTFLNPIFLWASLAILIPIIVHLFNFRRPKRVAFPDISLVKEVKKSVVKRLRLRQWLLLAARCLAILALVFVFAGPVWRNKPEAVTKGHSSVVVLLDNSYSMRAGNDKGEYWVQAQGLAREIIEAHSRSDEFLVMSSHAPRTHYNFGEQQAAIKDLKGLSIHQNTRSLAEVVAAADDIFANASNPSRKLYYISDFQRATVLPDSLQFPKLPPGLSLNLVPLTTRKLPNAFVADHQIATQIIEPGKQVQLKLTLVNDAPEPVKNIDLRVVVGNEDRPVATEDLAAGATSVIDVNLIPKGSGWQAGYIEMDDHPVEYDNKRYFTFYVPFREKMLVVEGAPSPHMRLIYGGEILNQFEVKFVTARDFAAENLDQYKSIVLSGVTEVPSGMQEKLNAHLKEGRSILFFPGEKMSVPSVNSFLNGLGVGSYGDFIENKAGESASGVDLDHPVFEGVFQKDSRSRKFDAPTIYRYYRFRPTPGSEQNVILATGSKEPVLVETRLGAGLFYTFNFFPGPSWTDFTLKSSGLALMVQLARVMNQTQQVEAAMDLGAGGSYRIKTTAKDVIRMIGNGLEITPEQFVQGGYVVLRFDRQDFPEGNYTLVQGQDSLERIAFNVPDAESRLAAHSEQELRDFFSERGVEGVEVTPGIRGQIAETIQMQQEGLPLWKYFLALAALFLILEFLILRVGKNSASA